MRRLVLAFAVVGLLALAGGSAASAEVQVPPKLLAEVILLEEPGFCHTVRKDVHILGYALAEEAYEEGYGENKHPSANSVFHWLVKDCT
jgi:hypothetical protein